MGITKNAQIDYEENKRQECSCNDPSCEREGEPNWEVGGHIEDCPCAKCHRYYSKLR